jgi:hypothetical protein
MKTVFHAMALVALGATFLASSGCKLVCKENEEEKGGQCIGKSLTRFEGTSDTKSVPFSSGQTVAVKGLFGHVHVVKGSTAGNITVTFSPFDYEGYDEKDLATRQMSEGLNPHIDSGADIVVQVERVGSTTSGLGCDVTLELPPDFDGGLVLDNAGLGTLASHNEFDVTADYVASATNVRINANSKLSDCYLQGADTVKSTTVTCGDVITVLDVADEVNITSQSNGNFDDPSVVLRVSSVAAGAKGGSIVTPEGGISATFPSTGDYAVQAYAPNGAVDMGSPPASCNVQEAGTGSKTLTCGGGSPIFKLQTDGENATFQKGQITVAYK